MAKTLASGVAGLISINKPHTENIFFHSKQFEWRKHPLPLGKYYVYETKRNGGCGMIIGEFRVCENRRYSTKHKLDLKFIPPVVVKLGCVDVDDLYRYGGGKPIYANLLNNIVHYEKPIELSRFVPPCLHDCENCKYSIYLERFEDYGCTKKRITLPPQSWRRVKELRI